MTFTQSFEDWINFFNKKSNSENYDFFKERMAFVGASSSYDTIRAEIHNCLVFEMNQAALMLTNHYLERLLKISIIEHKMSRNMDIIEEYANETEIHVNNHGSKDLEQSISQAKTLGIITKKEAEMLRELKDIFRNPFSHNDIKAMFKDETVQLFQFKFNDPTKIQQQAKVKISAFIPLQCAKQYEIARECALPYFIFIDDLACRIQMKTNPDYMSFQVEQDIDFQKVFDTYWDDGESLK